MAILGLQQQQTEVGRIRLGVKIETKSGKYRPAKLDTLRFTSPRRALIEKIAELYGGTCEPWQPPKGNQQWQVITTVTEVPVLVPPQRPQDSQWYEMWSKGGCLRRCDGRREIINDTACLCDPDPEERDCSMHTRIRVMLEEVQGLGVWRVDTGSYYAAVELPGVAALLAQANGMIPGRLILDQRTVTRAGLTRNFVVPVLDIAEFTPAEVLSGKVPELAAARRAAAIDGQASSQTAIAATIDYASLIGAARTVEALYDLHARAKADHAGEVPGDLMDLFGERANEIRASEAEPVEGEIIDATEWPGSPS
jgi:hypothetical protein